MAGCSVPIHNSYISEKHILKYTNIVASNCTTTVTVIAHHGRQVENTAHAEQPKGMGSPRTVDHLFAAHSVSALHAYA